MYVLPAILFFFFCIFLLLFLSFLLAFPVFTNTACEVMCVFRVSQRERGSLGFVELFLLFLFFFLLSTASGSPALSTCAHATLSI